MPRDQARGNGRPRAQRLYYSTSDPDPDDNPHGLMFGSDDTFNLNNPSASTDSTRARNAAETEASNPVGHVTPFQIGGQQADNNNRIPGENEIRDSQTTTESSQALAMPQPATRASITPITEVQLTALGSRGTPQDRHGDVEDDSFPRLTRSSQERHTSASNTRTVPSGVRSKVLSKSVSSTLPTVSESQPTDSLTQGSNQQRAYRVHGAHYSMASSMEPRRTKTQKLDRGVNSVSTAHVQAQNQMKGNRRYSFSKKGQTSRNGYQHFRFDGPTPLMNAFSFPHPEAHPLHPAMHRMPAMRNCQGIQAIRPLFYPPHSIWGSFQPSQDSTWEGNPQNALVYTHFPPPGHPPGFPFNGKSGGAEPPQDLQPRQRRNGDSWTPEQSSRQQPDREQRGNTAERTTQTSNRSSRELGAVCRDILEEERLRGHAERRDRYHSRANFGVDAASANNGALGAQRPRADFGGNSGKEEHQNQRTAVPQHYETIRHSDTQYGNLEGASAGSGRSSSVNDAYRTTRNGISQAVAAYGARSRSCNRVDVSSDSDSRSPSAGPGHRQKKKYDNCESSKRAINTAHSTYRSDSESAHCKHCNRRKTLACCDKNTSTRDAGSKKDMPPGYRGYDASDLAQMERDMVEQQQRVVRNFPKEITRAFTETNAGVVPGSSQKDDRLKNAETSSIDSSRGNSGPQSSGIHEEIQAEMERARQMSIPVTRDKKKEARPVNHDYDRLNPNAREFAPTIVLKDGKGNDFVMYLNNGVSHFYPRPDSRYVVYNGRATPDEHVYHDHGADAGTEPVVHASIMPGQQQNQFTQVYQDFNQQNAFHQVPSYPVGLQPNGTHPNVYSSQNQIPVVAPASGETQTPVLVNQQLTNAVPHPGYVQQLPVPTVPTPLPVETYSNVQYAPPHLALQNLGRASHPGNPNVFNFPPQPVYPQTPFSQPGQHFQDNFQLVNQNPALASGQPSVNPVTMVQQTRVSPLFQHMPGHVPSGVYAQNVPFGYAPVAQPLTIPLPPTQMPFMPTPYDTPQQQFINGLPVPHVSAQNAGNSSNIHRVNTVTSRPQNNLNSIPERNVAEAILTDDSPRVSVDRLDNHAPPASLEHDPETISNINGNLLEENRALPESQVALKTGPETFGANTTGDIRAEFSELKLLNEKRKSLQGRNSLDRQIANLPPTEGLVTRAIIKVLQHLTDNCNVVVADSDDNNNNCSDKSSENAYTQKVFSFISGFVIPTAFNGDQEMLDIMFALLQQDLNLITATLSNPKAEEKWTALVTGFQTCGLRLNENWIGETLAGINVSKTSNSETTTTASTDTLDNRRDELSLAHSTETTYLTQTVAEERSLPIEDQAGKAAQTSKDALNDLRAVQPTGEITPCQSEASSLTSSEAMSGSTSCSSHGSSPMKSGPASPTVLINLTEAAAKSQDTQGAVPLAHRTKQKGASRHSSISNRPRSLASEVRRKSSQSDTRSPALKKVDITDQIQMFERITKK